MTLYLAGPMSGHPLYNYPAFEAAARALREAGHAVISPHELELAQGFKPADSFPDSAYAAAMRRSIAALLEADAVVMLPGWESSRGACLEHAIATALGIPIHEGAP